MTEKNEMELKNKVDDYRRFSFILLALSGFLMIGVVLPNAQVTSNSQAMLLGAIGILLVLSVMMHLVAKRAIKLLNQENK